MSDRRGEIRARLDVAQGYRVEWPDHSPGTLAEFIAHAPADVAYLLAELERLDLPTRSRPGSSRTVWVEIDVAELDEVRGALVRRSAFLSERLDEVERDDSVEVSLALERTRAVLDRLPNAEAMLRRYP